MHLSQIFTLALVSFASHAVAAPLEVREPNVLPRSPALNAIHTTQSVWNAKREPTPPPMAKREPALNAGYNQIYKAPEDLAERALNAGYKESFQNAAAPEKRSLNAVAGYKQIINNAAEEMGKRALNAGYNQIYKAPEALAERSPEPEPALNAGYNQIYKAPEDLAERSPGPEPEPALNAGTTYKQVVYPGAAPEKAEKRAPTLNAGYNQNVKPANKRFAEPAPDPAPAPAPALNAGYNQIYKAPEDLAERDAPRSLPSGYTQTVCNKKRALNACRIAARSAEPALNAGYNQYVEPEQ